MGRDSKHDDSYIRLEAIQHKMPYVTTMAAALASVEGIEAMSTQTQDVKALQDYYV